jgi:hypothetical protein
MNDFHRNGNKWTVNELLSLQREYELLELDIQQIAVKHKRSIRAILFRLETEGFIDSWHDARGYSNVTYDDYDNYVCDDISSLDENHEHNFCDNKTECSADDHEEEDVSIRVEKLEITVDNILVILEKMFNSFMKKNQENNISQSN